MAAVFSALWMVANGAAVLNIGTSSWSACAWLTNTASREDVRAYGVEVFGAHLHCAQHLKCAHVSGLKRRASQRAAWCHFSRRISEACQCFVVSASSATARAWVPQAQRGNLVVQAHGCIVRVRRYRWRRCHVLCRKPGAHWRSLRCNALWDGVGIGHVPCRP